MASQELGVIKTAVQKLAQLQKTKGSLETVNETLKEIAAGCAQGIPHRVAAGTQLAEMFLGFEVSKCFRKSWCLHSVARYLRDI